MENALQNDLHPPVFLDIYLLNSLKTLPIPCCPHTCKTWVTPVEQPKYRLISEINKLKLSSYLSTLQSRVWSNFTDQIQSPFTNEGYQIFLEMLTPVVPILHFLPLATHVLETRREQISYVRHSCLAIGGWKFNLLLPLAKHLHQIIASLYMEWLYFSMFGRLTHTSGSLVRWESCPSQFHGYAVIRWILRWIFSQNYEISSIHSGPVHILRKIRPKLSQSVQSKSRILFQNIRIGTQPYFVCPDKSAFLQTE